MEKKDGDLVSFVIDGAWIAGSSSGAATWVLESSGGEPIHQSISCLTRSSATAVDVQAGLLVLECSIKENLKIICIKTDCLVFVQGLTDPCNALFCV